MKSSYDKFLPEFNSPRSRFSLNVNSTTPVTRGRVRSISVVVPKKINKNPFKMRNVIPDVIIL